MSMMKLLRGGGGGEAISLPPDNVGLSFMWIIHTSCMKSRAPEISFFCESRLSRDPCWRRTYVPPHARQNANGGLYWFVADLFNTMRCPRQHPGDWKVTEDGRTAVEDWVLCKLHTTTTTTTVGADYDEQVGLASCRQDTYMYISTVGKIRVGINITNKIPCRAHRPAGCSNLAADRRYVCGASACHAALLGHFPPGHLHVYHPDFCHQIFANLGHLPPGQLPPGQLPT
jgi:hypothetical protein